MYDFELVSRYEFNGIKTPVDLNHLYEEGITFEELDDLVIGQIKRHTIAEGDDCVKFLEEFDPTRGRSLRIAYEMGLTVSEADSYTLAKLRYQEMLFEAWDFAKSDVKEVINNKLNNKK